MFGTLPRLLSFCCVLVSSSATLAVPISYTFTGIGTGTIFDSAGGVNATFTNAQYTITLNADTSTIGHPIRVGGDLTPILSIFINPITTGTISITGVGTATITGPVPVEVFDNHDVGGIGFLSNLPGGDFIGGLDPAFATYVLDMGIGPIPNIQTLSTGHTPLGSSLGTIVLTSSSFTFAAQTEPQVLPPTIAKSFGATTIPLQGTTTVSFTLTNPNGDTTLNNIGFTDTLPAGLIVAMPNGLTGACGAGTITATAGTGTIGLVGTTGSPGANCTFSVNVTGMTAGVKVNSVTVTSTEATGNTASATVTVVAPPAIAKQFGAASIAFGGTTTLTFTVTNSNATTALTGVAFTDTLPSGLAVSTPNELTGSCGGGTITATTGSSSVILTGATIAASDQCTFSLNVTGTTAGTKNNMTGAVTSVEGGPGGTAWANVTVGTSCIYSLSPLDLSNTVAAGGSLSITVTTLAGCPVTATSYQPWVTVNSITPDGGTTTVALQVSANAGAARATSIVVADRLFLITQLVGL